VLLTHGDRLEIKHAAVLLFQQPMKGEQPEVMDCITFEREKKYFDNQYSFSKRVLGVGGYGKVYMAWDTKVHKQVACKVVELRKPAGSDEEKFKKMKEMLMRELEILVGLSHVSCIPQRKMAVY
jgi:hypothetical protein